MIHKEEAIEESRSMIRRFPRDDNPSPPSELEKLANNNLLGLQEDCVEAICEHDNISRRNLPTEVQQRHELRAKASPLLFPGENVQVRVQEGAAVYQGRQVAVSVCSDGHDV